MPWSGPGIGGQPYQQPLPYANGQPGYNSQQSYQYGQPAQHNQWQKGTQYPPNGAPQRTSEIRPSKKKGNPVITRYPPPPGYRGPAQPQGPYGSNAYPTQYQHHPQTHPQPHHQGYSAPPISPAQSYPPPQQAYPPNQGYPPQGYGQPPQNYLHSSTYPQVSYSQGQAYQQPSQPYPASAQSYVQGPSYGQAQSYPGPQAYTAIPNTYQGYQAHSTPVEPMQQSYPQQQPGWPQQNSQTSYPPPEQSHSYNEHPTAPSQDPNATPTPTSAHVVTPQNNPATIQTGDPNEKPQLYLAWDDWDYDFEGPIWPKSNEPVDPKLSLGLITWLPGIQVTRALPSTFAQAEEQSLQSPPEKLGNGESVSIYFTLENSHEAFLDVRQTDHWNDTKDDPVFVVFPDEKDMELVPLEECIAKRDRPDEVLEGGNQDVDQDMKDVSWSVMDNLEQALAGHESDVKVPLSTARPDHSRIQNQEDILAMLGVTGSPKPPSNESASFPFPIFGESPTRLPQEQPPMHVGHAYVSFVPDANQVLTQDRLQSQTRRDKSPQTTQSYSSHHNSTRSAPPQRQSGSMSASIHNAQDHHNPWNATNGHSVRTGHPYDSSRGSPARSEGSNKTLAGSDFEAERGTNGTDRNSGSIPLLERSDSSFSRKRSYDDSDQNDEKMRQQDDHTKRKRRSEVAAAYSRR